MIKDFDIIKYENNLSIIISIFLDINNIFISSQINILNVLINLKVKIIVNIIMKNKIINDYEDETFFISAFSTLFSYNIKKYINFKHDI